MAILKPSNQQASQLDTAQQRLFAALQKLAKAQSPGSSWPQVQALVGAALSVADVGPEVCLSVCCIRSLEEVSRTRGAANSFVSYQAVSCSKQNLMLFELLFMCHGLSWIIWTCG